MKVVVRQEHHFVDKALHECTYQAGFPSVVECVKCKGRALPLLVLEDDEGLISEQREFLAEGGIWPHDCLGIALYLCRTCSEITALWNQG